MARAEDRIALIELLDRDGRVLRQHDVHGWPVTIGRGLDCTLVLDDTHVAARHATLDVDADGRLWLAAEPSHNGIRFAGQRRLAAGERTALETPGTTWQLGGTTLRLRRSTDPLPAEEALHPASPGHGWRATLAFSLVWWAALLVEHWIDLDPDAKLSDWLGVVFVTPLAVVAWCGAWGLASKLFRHRVDLGPHWGIAARGGLALTLTGLLLPPAAAALGWPGLNRLQDPLLVVIAVAWLWGHARRVLPQFGRMMATMASVALIVGGAVSATLRDQREQPWVGPLYMSELPQPGWRVPHPQTPESFVDAANALRGVVDERARSDREPEADAEDEPGE